MEIEKKIEKLIEKTTEKITKKENIQTEQHARDFIRNTLKQFPTSYIKKVRDNAQVKMIHSPKFMVTYEECCKELDAREHLENQNKLVSDANKKM